MYLWGSNKFGQLGRTSKPRFLIPNGLKLTQSISKISCGLNFTLALTQEGKVMSAGDNSQNQLGGIREGNSHEFHQIEIFEKTKVKITRIDAGAHSLAITDKGSLYLWGKTPIGSFSSPNKQTLITTPVIDGSVGISVTGLLDVKGKVWVMNESSDNKTAFLINKHLSNKVSSITCGGNHIIMKGSDVPIQPSNTEYAHNMKSKI